MEAPGRFGAGSLGGAARRPGPPPPAPGRAPLPPRGRPGRRPARRRRSRAGCASRPGTSSVAGVPPSWRCVWRESGADVCLLSELDSGMARTEERGRHRPPSRRTSVPATPSASSSSSSAWATPRSSGRRVTSHNESRPARQRHRHAGPRWATRGSSGCPDAGLGWFADRLAAAPRGRPHGRRRHGRHRRRRGGGRVGPPGEPHRPRAPRRTDGGAVAGARRRGATAVRPSSAATSTRSAPATPSCSTGRWCARCARTDPARFTWPVALRTALRRGAGTRVRVDRRRTSPHRRRTHDARGLPDHVPIRLDWLFVRGLVARRPAVVPAGGLSDHHVVSVGVRLP